MACSRSLRPELKFELRETPLRRRTLHRDGVRATRRRVEVEPSRELALREVVAKTIARPLTATKPFGVVSVNPRRPRRAIARGFDLDREMGSPHATQTPMVGRLATESLPDANGVR